MQSPIPSPPGNAFSLHLKAVRPLSALYPIDAPNRSNCAIFEDLLSNAGGKINLAASSRRGSKEIKHDSHRDSDGYREEDGAV